MVSDFGVPLWLPEIHAVLFIIKSIVRISGKLHVVTNIIVG